MAFPTAFTDELMQRSDIVDIVGSYVSLATKGGRLWGLCPFHNEKTPSFKVDADKQVYYCFGCGKGGGVVNFIMEIENLDYPDAVRYLARRAGLEVPEDDKYTSTFARKKAICDLNRDAARFFYDTLIAEQGKPGMEYLAGSRQLKTGTIKKFGLGYAPDSWDALSKAMTEKGYSFENLTDAGLASARKNGNGIYDRFRARVMFPIIDVTGNIIGFSGRVLDGSEPKYINTPETLAYNKGSNLYGMNLAKKSKAGNLILAEGNLDVISLHQAGFDSAVASCGTALTESQVKLISKYTDNVVIAYDGDEAGVNAAKKAINLLSKADVSIKVLKLGDCKDPDEFIKKYGADGFKKLLEKSENHIEYQLSAVMGKYNLSDDDQKVMFLKEATALIAALNNRIEREVYGARVAEAASVSLEALKNEIETTRKRNLSRERKKEQQAVLAPEKSIQPKTRELKYKNVKSARAEEMLIRIVSADPSYFAMAERLGAEDFSSEVLGRAFSGLKNRWYQGQATAVAALESEFSREEMAHLISVVQEDADLLFADKAVGDCVNIIKSESEKREGSTAEERLRAMMNQKKAK